MQGAISYNDLGLLVLFLLILVGGGYLIVTLKNANRLIKDVTGILDTNREQINKTVANAHQITETGVDISGEAKKSMAKAGKAIDVISRDTTETILSINKTADEIGTYALVIGEVAKAVTNLFVTDRK